MALPRNMVQENWPYLKKSHSRKRPQIGLEKKIYSGYTNYKHLNLRRQRMGAAEMVEESATLAPLPGDSVSFTHMTAHNWL